MKHLPMRKLRDGSTWSQLKPEQHEKLEHWLFDENLSYAKTLERVESEFGIKSTVTSLYRYYRRRMLERQQHELQEVKYTALTVNALQVDKYDLRTAALTLISKHVLKLASEKPEGVEQLAALTGVLLEAEQNDIRRGRLQLAQRCFDYEKTVATVKEIPQIRAYMQAIVYDQSLSDDERTKKIQDLLFHWAKEVKAGNVK